MFERETDVQGVADALAEDLGTDIEGDAHHRRTAPGCAAERGIDESDAWYERNTYSVMDHPGGAEALYPALVAHLEDRGFTVDELVAPLSGSRGLRAVRDDVTVLADFGDVGANLTVTAGPCAVELSPIGERYEVVEP